MRQRLSLTYNLLKYRFLAALALFGAYPGTVGYVFVFMYRAFTGTTAASYSILTFDVKTKAIYVWAWDAPMYIEISYDGTNYDTAIEVINDTGVPLKLSLCGLKARVVDKVAGDHARYQVVAWYVISKRRH